MASPPDPPRPYHSHLPKDPADRHPSLVVTEDRPGHRVLYLHGISRLAVPLTPTVVRWLRGELDNLPARTTGHSSSGWNER